MIPSSRSFKISTPDHKTCVASEQNGARDLSRSRINKILFLRCLNHIHIFLGHNPRVHEDLNLLQYDKTAIIRATIISPQHLHDTIDRLLIAKNMFDTPT